MSTQETVSGSTSGVEPEFLICCPTCNSPRLVCFRLDSDWYQGGYTHLANGSSPEVYTEEDLAKVESNLTLDIQCHVCLACGTCS
jgi:hypothetical protein